MLERDVYVYQCKTAVAVYLPEASMVFDKRSHGKAAPCLFRSGFMPSLHTQEYPSAKGRWEKMTRREASEWVSRAETYYQSQ
jgi:hypothetical protein